MVAATDLYFLVMNNLKLTLHEEKLTEIFDLKGSSVNRSMRVPKNGERVDKCRHCGQSFTYYKDDVHKKAHR